MNQIIVTGGEGPSWDYIKGILHGDTRIIAADSGWDKCKSWGILPDLLIGDMDSVEDRKGVETFHHEAHRHPVDKDHSDTELALAQCDPNHPILLIGGGGGRTDHLLSIIELFRSKMPIERWITAQEDIFYVKNHCHIEGWPGRRVSLYPLNPAEGYCLSKGLKWEIQRDTWQNFSLSLSNVMLGSQFDLECHDLDLLCMLEIPPNLD